MLHFKDLVQEGIINRGNGDGSSWMTIVCIILNIQRFVLHNRCNMKQLMNAKFQDKEPRGIIPLENVQVRDVNDRTRINCFEIYATNSDIIKACKTDSEGKVIEGKKRL